MQKSRGTFSQRLSAIRRAGRVAVIASLPRNDPSLAARAFAAGAVAVKVHAGVRHLASGVTFGSLEEERPAIEAIVAEASKHDAFVGIVLGPGDRGRRELEIVAGCGVHFIDGFLDELGVDVLNVAGLEIMAALRPGTPLELVRGLNELPRVHVVEAAVVPPEGYGRRLTLADVAMYRAIATATAKPVVVPSERRIEPGDMEWLRQAGISAVMAGIVVFGEASSEAVGRTVEAFDRAGRSPKSASGGLER